MWQPETVTLNKITKSLEYWNTTNYWAPHLDKIDKTETEHKEANIVVAKQTQSEAKANKWT
jgi:hypothetical protein